MGLDATYNNGLRNRHQILRRLNNQPWEPGDGPPSIVSAIDGFGGECPGGFVAFEVSDHIRIGMEVSVAVS